MEGLVKNPKTAANMEKLLNRFCTYTVSQRHVMELVVDVLRLKKSFEGESDYMFMPEDVQKAYLIVGEVMEESWRINNPNTISITEDYDLFWKPFFASIPTSFSSSRAEPLFSLSTASFPRHATFFPSLFLVYVSVHTALNVHGLLIYEMARRELFLFLVISVSQVAALLPEYGRSYAIFNKRTSTDFYLSWTTNTAVVNFAQQDTPALNMQRGFPRPLPPHALWLFSLQDDGTYRIYVVDNSYIGDHRRLYVYAGDRDPVLGLVNPQRAAQIWKIDEPEIWDDGFLQIINEGRDRVLGLDVYGDETDANYPNAPALLASWNVDTIEQRWQVVDLTPSNNVTAQYVVTT